MLLHVLERKLEVIHVIACENFRNNNADMMELVDMQDLESCAGNSVRVRGSLSVPN